MDLNNLSIASTGAGVLEIWLTDTDFSLDDPSGGIFRLFGGGTLTGPTGTKIEFRAMYDETNSEYGVGATDFLPTSGPASFGPGVVGFDVTKLVEGVTNPFSLTLYAKVTATGAITLSSFDAQTTVVNPEPLSALVWSGIFGVAGLVGLVRRRRKTV
jgi:hypothetical protein